MRMIVRVKKMWGGVIVKVRMCVCEKRNHCILR